MLQFEWSFFPSRLVFLTFYRFCLSFQLFCYVVYVPLFCSGSILLSYHLVVGMCLCILLLLVKIIFVNSFGMSYFVCIVLSCLDIFLVFFLFCQCLLIYFLDLYCLFYLYCFFRFVTTCFSVFPQSYPFLLVVHFQSNFPSRVCVSFRVL